MTEKFDICEEAGGFLITDDVGYVYRAQPKTSGCDGCAFVYDDAGCVRAWCAPPAWRMDDSSNPLTQFVVWVKEQA